MAAGRRRSGRVLILLALVIVVIIAGAAFLFRDQLLGILSPQSQAQQLSPQEGTSAAGLQSQTMQQIVIVAQPISRGTVITESMLGMIAYPQDQMVAGLLFTDLQSVVGKRARFDLAQGTPLTNALITDAPSGSYAAFQIPSGMVAVSIPISKLSSVAYSVQSGDHVNVLVSIKLVDLDQEFQSVLPNSLSTVQKSIIVGEQVLTTDLTLNINPATIGLLYQDPSLASEYIYKRPSEAQRSRRVNQTLVQDAIVLWVGEFPADQNVNEVTTAATSPTPIPEGQAALAAPRPDVITLIVSPQDAVALDYLVKSNAELTLVLRGTGDTQTAGTNPVTLQFIMDQYNIPLPPKLPYGFEQPIAPTATLAYPAQ